MEQMGQVVSPVGGNLGGSHDVCITNVESRILLPTDYVGDSCNRPGFYALRRRARSRRLGPKP